MTKSVRRYIIPLLISIILLSTSAQAIYVHRYEQKYSQWCWAASAQMIGHTMGRDVTQSAIVEFVKGAAENAPAADIYEASRAVDYATLLYSTAHFSPLTYASAQAELSAGEPFYVRIGWDSKDGHAVVASGYNLSAGTITIVDPAVECGTKAFSYSAMVSGCTFQSGTGTWTHTVTI